MGKETIYDSIDEFERKILETVGISRSDYTIADIEKEDMHFLEFGKHHKTTIILIHGYGGSGVTFYRIIPELMKYFHVIAIDLLGFGKSDRPSFTFDNFEKTIQFYTIPIVTMINYKKLDKFILLGHSLGGLIASHLALLVKEKLLVLFLVASAGFTNKGFTEEEAEILLRKYGKVNDVAPKIVQVMNYITYDKKIPIFNYVMPSWIKDYVDSYFDDDRFGLNIKEKVLFKNYYKFVHTLKACGTNSVWSLVKFGGYCDYPSLDILVQNRDINCFVYYGDGDWLDYEHAYQECKKHNLHMSFRILPDTNHQVFFHRPDTFLCQFFIDMQKVLRENAR